MFRNNSSNTNESESPIYNQIVQMEQIEIHKMKVLVEEHNGFVLDYNTDCISCTFPDDILPDNILNNYWDDKETVLKYKLEDKDRLKYERGKESCRVESYILPENKWVDSTDVEDSNFKPLVDMISNKKSHLILGSAGCGKSTLIKKIQEELNIQDKNYITLCPTNKACLIIPDAMTLTKFKSKLNDQ
jgi:type IV secretory pathway ATPase VirB11/archaellum biosynthesis ATPase